MFAGLKEVDEQQKLNSRRLTHNISTSDSPSINSFCFFSLFIILL